MNIIAEIRKCVLKAEIKHTQKVTRLYLGRVERGWLEHEKEKTSRLEPSGLNPARLVWEGKEVFEVDSAYHLAAGFDP